jgi:hypothetical protein
MRQTPSILARIENPANTIYKVRSAKFITLADSDLIDKICTFLAVLKIEPPVPEARFDKVAAFWKALQATHKREGTPSRGGSSASVCERRAVGSGG